MCMGTHHFIESHLNMRLRKRNRNLAPTETGGSHFWKADWGIERDPRQIEDLEKYGKLMRSHVSDVEGHDLIAMTERLIASGEYVPDGRHTQAYPVRVLYRDKLEPNDPRGSIQWDYVVLDGGHIAAQSIEAWSEVEGTERRQRLERVLSGDTVRGERLYVDGVLRKEQHHELDESGELRLVVEQHYSEDGKPVAIIDMSPDPRLKGMWLTRTVLRPKTESEEVIEREVSLFGLPRLSIDGPGRIIEDLHLEAMPATQKVVA